MWIVRLALRRPYPFVVMGLTILLLGVFAIVTTPTDIFPEIDIPVVSAIRNYEGLTTDDMASRITTFSEYTISSAVSDVRTIESQTYPGVTVVTIYFQPNVNVEAALAQVTAVSQTILRCLPPGSVPPLIIQYDARDDGTVEYLRVQLGRDLGQSVEIVSELKGQERLVASPPDGLRDGIRVVLASGSDVTTSKGDRR
jgi:multidrug efflux pump subunit AcrB